MSTSDTKARTARFHTARVRSKHLRLRHSMNSLRWVKRTRSTPIPSQNRGRRHHRLSIQIIARNGARRRDGFIEQVRSVALQPWRGDAYHDGCSVVVANSSHPMDDLQPLDDANRRFPRRGQISIGRPYRGRGPPIFARSQSQRRRALS